MVWKFEKFKGDMTIYAQCPRCNFRYGASTFNYKTMETTITKEYNYCPMCGEYLCDDSESVNVIWNERDIDELYKIEGE